MQVELSILHRMTLKGLESLVEVHCEDFMKIEVPRCDFIYVSYNMCFAIEDGDCIGDSIATL
jgi:hypothetical protein